MKYRFASIAAALALGACSPSAPLENSNRPSPYDILFSEVKQKGIVTGKTETYKKYERTIAGMRITATSSPGVHSLKLEKDGNYCYAEEHGTWEGTLLWRVEDSNVHLLFRDLRCSELAEYANAHPEPKSH